MLQRQLVLLIFACLVFSAESQRPPIVVFLSDDLSWRDTPLSGDSKIAMPNLTAMARDGMILTHAFVVSPSCGPSRAALLTGLDPVVNGALFNHQRPDPRHRMWPAYFKDLGYQVVAFGKVGHYHFTKEHGFDHTSDTGYHEDACIAHAVDWLAKRQDPRPLCLMVGTNWPHVPWPEETSYNPATLTLPPGMIDTEETRAHFARYAAAVANADRDLGLVRAAVRQYLPQALMVFTSDHGAQIPFYKWNAYDGGIRTPLVVTWEGHIAPGSRSDALVCWTDLLPTLLTAVGGTPPSGKPGAGGLNGRSFLPVLTGTATVHRDLIAVSHSGDGQMNRYPLRAVRDRRWKYIRNLASEREFHSPIDLDTKRGPGYFPSWVAAAMRDAGAAAVVQRYHHRPAEELYDLFADPDEQHNLAADPTQLETLTRLRGELDRWMAENADEGLATEERARPKKTPASTNNSP